MTVPGQTGKACTSCGTVNRPDCRFCTGCGKGFPLSRACPRCNAALLETQHFCNSCGAPADTAATSSGPDQKKFCHQCRALIDRDAKFCNMCGTTISNLPVCPRCGDPIGPTEKFCGVCGMPFGTTSPARQPPVQPAPQPTVQPRNQGGMSPSPSKKGGIPVVRIAIGVVIVLVLIVGIVMLLPDTTPPPPPAGDPGTSGPTVPSGENTTFVQQSERESRQMLDRAAAALENGDITAFSRSLDPAVLSRFGSVPVFRSGGAQNLAAALRNARVVQSNGAIIYYQADSGGTSFGFHTFREGNSWFISGL